MRYLWLWVVPVLIGVGLILRCAAEDRPAVDLPPGSNITVLMREDLDARDASLGARFDAVVLQGVDAAGRRVLEAGMRLGGRVEGLLAHSNGAGVSQVSGIVLRFDRVYSGRGRPETIATRPIVWPPQSIGGLLGTREPVALTRLMLDESPRLPRGHKLTVEIVGPAEPRVQQENDNRRIE